MPLSEAKDFFNQILTKAQKGDSRGAIEDLNWVLQVDPQDAQAYCCRGIVRSQMGDNRGAMVDLNQALRLNSQDTMAHRSRGKVRSQLGDHQGALADINQALQLAPQDGSIYVTRGNAYRAMGNYLRAVEDYSQALQINPNDAKAYYHRGIAYSCIEEMQRAVEDYQMAAKLFCDRSDWINYQKTLDSLKQIQSPAGKTEAAVVKRNQLRQKLLRLVGGYWEIAERLIEQAKGKNPGMQEEWYWEKVIYDLERDRNR